MKKRVMIASVFSGEAVKLAITKLSPDILICVVEKGYDKVNSSDLKTKRETIKELKKVFGGVLDIEVFETKSLYDIYEITKDIIKKIDSINSENEIIVHVSEGRKPLAFGLSFAAYMRKEKIKTINYAVKEEKRLIQFPIFSFPINKIKKIILKSIDKKVGGIDSLIKKTKKSRSVVYQYVKELQDDGYILGENKHLELTDLGRIMIL